METASLHACGRPRSFASSRRVARTERGADGTVERTEYVWDCRDRLREVRLPDGRVARYRYDAFARRVSKELIPKERAEFARALAIAAEKGPEALPPVERTEFLWDGDVLCEERVLAAPVVRAELSDGDVGDPAPDGAAAAPAPAYKRVFVHEPDTFLPMLQQEGGKTYAYVLDHLGTPKELIDERGRVAWSAAYSAWGRIVGTAKDRGTTAVESPFRLLGQYEDRETGLRYTRYRYFEAETGRWLSPDPLGTYGSANLLGFDGEPINDADPFGLVCRNKRPRNAPRLSNPRVKKVVWHRDGSVTYHFHGGFQVKYNARGFPDFGPHTMRRGGEPVETRIRYTGDRDSDFAAANAKMGWTETPDGYTWHHTENVRVGSTGTTGSMILVKTEVHQAATHRGGVSVHKERGGSGYDD